MDTNNQSIMVEGANPDMIWAQIMDNLATRANSMKAERTRRIRRNQPFTWNDIDEINNMIHHDLDVIVSGNRNVEENKQYSMNANVKRRARLTESDLHRIVKESVKKVLRESYHDYVEVRSNYYDEDKGATAIDAWETIDDNEGGQIVAWVYDDGTVDWVVPDARFSPMVKEEIDQVLNSPGH